ncbi:hypothetical protein [Aestuariivivens sediminis]|uniref:hypothetical protein n=1 Tax=Aestuariivivens sediminis TaxID=2913557 RepID=UPI001F5A392A|nr:hypothetical protein [Aestuariivivens sediminis]
MRILYTIILLILLTGCKTQRPELSIVIKEVEDIENINFEGHQNHDVEVYRIKTVQPEYILPKLDPEPKKRATDAIINKLNKDSHFVYALIIYRNQNGKVRNYRAHIISEFTFDVADYEWINDSTVTFNIKNKFRSLGTYTFSGYMTANGRVTSMKKLE